MDAFQFDFMQLLMFGVANCDLGIFRYGGKKNNYGRRFQGFEFNASAGHQMN